MKRAKIGNEVFDITSDEVLDLIQLPAPINMTPGDRYYRNYRYFAMQASIEITKKGRLWSCWIGGADGPHAYLIATYSDDFGNSWQDIRLVIDPHDDALPMNMNTHIGCLWQDPLGRLWLFYQQSFGMWDGKGANYAIVCDDPDAENPVWGEPRYISIGASLKKPIVLKNGEWLLPVSIWERSHISYQLRDAHKELDGMRGAHVFASVDMGESWVHRGGLCFTNHRFNEHSLAEVEEGKIVMYSRCTDAIRRSYSTDGGRSWSEEEVAFLHVNSLAMIRTLPSGNLLLIKHGEDMQTPTPVRSHLTAFVSSDMGNSWRGGLLLDERRQVSYPDIAISTDGEIFVQRRCRDPVCQIYRGGRIARWAFLAKREPCAND